MSYLKSANSAFRYPIISISMNLNHVGATSPKRVSFSPIVFFPSVRTLYSQERANAHPPAGLEPFKIMLLIFTCLVKDNWWFTLVMLSILLIMHETIH